MKRSACLAQRVYFLLVLFFLLQVLALPGRLRAGPYLGLEIRLQSDHVAVNEPIRGEVVITSSIPGTFPVNFDVALYQGERLYRRVTVNTPVFLGSTKTDLQDFGLRNFSMGALPTPGTWRLVIEANSTPVARAVAEITVTPNDSKVDP